MRRNRSERGAIAALAAIMSTVLFLSAAFAIDLGLQRDARRDAQAVADVVALDLARMLTGKAASTYDTSAIDTARNESVTRNDSVIGGTLSASDVSWSFAKRNADDSGWVTVANSSSDVPTAIKVSVSSSVGFAFGGFTHVTRGDVNRTAVASSADPFVCFSIGTRTLTLNTDQSALSPLLSKILSVNLSAVGYDGIVGLTNVSVPLADLMVNLGVGSYSDVLTTSVSLNKFILAAADALQTGGDAVDASVLKAIHLGVSGLPIKLSDILNLQTGTDTSALDADVNVFDLLSAAIVAANGQNAVAVGIPGVADLKVIEPPQIACGSKNVVAHSAQIKATVAPTLVTSMVNSLGLTSANVSLALEVAPGTATLKALGCGPKKAILDVSTAGVTLDGTIGLGLSLSKIPGLGGLLKGALQLLGLDPVGLKVDAVGGVGVSDYPSEEFDFPDPPALPGTLVVPSEDGVSQTLTLEGTNVRSTDGGLVGGTLTALLGLVTPLVTNTIVPALDSAVITPLVNTLLDTLGIKLGVAEVNMLNTVTCDNIKLVG